MTRLRFYQCAVLVVIVALCAFGQMALAQSAHHGGFKVISRAQANGAGPDSGPAANLYGQTAVFATTPSVSYASPINSDGSDLWPCFGGATAANPDCPTIGDPSQAFVAAENGVVTGDPEYVWSLSGCDATSPSSPYCGETENFYEDTTGDTTDDLIWTATITQGSGSSLKYVYDSGIQDYGPCAFGDGPGCPGGTPTYPLTVIFYQYLNMGTMGVATGPNNGNCDADAGYPLTSDSYPGYYVIAAGKTCSAPVSGAAAVTITTELGTAKYTKSTKATVCGSVGTPCYTVKFTKKYAVTQKFDIWLE